MTRPLTFILFACGALLVPAAALQAAPADDLRIHAIFSGGRSAGLAVGEPLAISYTQGKARAKRICWTPAPIEAPTCAAPSHYRAPSRSGTQRLRITLSDGKVIKRTFRVRPAATKLPGFSGAPALPMRVSCPTRFFLNVRKDGKLRDLRGSLEQGTHVAAYYRVRGHSRIVQVWSYSSHQAGFVYGACLKPTASRTSVG